ncbi:MAG: gephyrin-like molybdotransferase Glp [Anaerolineales bacterium]
MKDFASESRYPMIPMEEAIQIILEIVRPLHAICISRDELLGHVLAEDVRAEENMPPFATSRMDGYAIVAEDNSQRRRILGEGIAGAELDVTVTPGTAMRIMTGAPLPPGADAVIPVEETCEVDGYVTLPGAVPQGQYVHEVGGDYSVGDLIIPEGSVVGPPEIGLLANLGRAKALAHPRVRVAVMATGDELVGADETPGPGQIRDSNSYALCAAVRDTGAIAQRVDRIVDKRRALYEALLEAASEASVVITSGGVSMGTRDLVKPVLAELGTVHFGRVAIKPGKPLTMATIEGAIVFGLPGFPVSSLVSFENVVRPVLRVMMGHRALWRPEITARLRHDIAHKPDRTEFQRAVVRQDDDGTWWATTTGSQVSSRLKSLVGANALLRIPQGVGDLATGEKVQALRIDLPEEQPT